MAEHRIVAPKVSGLVVEAYESTRKPYGIAPAVLLASASTYVPLCVSVSS